jgi:hypothetical protein
MEQKIMREEGNQEEIHEDQENIADKPSETKDGSDSTSDETANLQLRNGWN